MAFLSEHSGFADVIYYGSFLVFPFLIFLSWTRKSWKTALQKSIFVMLFLLCGLFVYARFVEPQLIIVRETDIETGFSAKIVLIADLHLGVYKGDGFLRRVVEKINRIDADAVLIGGDFTYWPRSGAMDRLFAAFDSVNKPVIAVLGNHDVERPGPPVRSELSEVLNKNAVQLLNNNSVQMDGYTLVALGDNWSMEDDITLLQPFDPEDNIVVLTHNPDTTSRYTTSVADLTLTGHTHCGQIRIPWLYKYVIPTEGDFDKGLTFEEKTRLYITCGLGEVGLPMRLLNPPVIDVLTLY